MCGRKEVAGLPLFGLLVGGQRVVQLGDALLKLVHHQRPVVVEEHCHRLGKLRLPAALRLPVCEGNSQRVLVVEPTVTCHRHDNLLAVFTPLRITLTLL